MGILPPLEWPMLTDSQMWAILLACGMMLFDIAAGFVGAFVRHDVQSAKMREGLGHKVLMLVIIAMVYILDVGLTHVSGSEIFVPATEVVCGYIIVMEFASVLENVAEAWPEFGASKAFTALQKAAGGDNDGTEH